MANDPDIRLDEGQIGMIAQMLEMNPEMDEREAKLRVMTIGKTPENMMAVPARGGKFPMSLYHEDGRIKVAKNDADLKEAKKNGWVEKPSQIHVDVTLAADIKRQQNAAKAGF
jgi:hypothetical protein